MIRKIFDIINAYTSITEEEFAVINQSIKVSVQKVREN